MTRSPKPRALDLFCGAGGATRGLQLAGFHVTGVDIAPQPNYCGDAFYQADATAFPIDGYDFVWASPPCQAHSTLRHRHRDRDYACFIETTRQRLIASGIPYVIENVVGAPLGDPVMLCGSMFGLRVRRHRLFEASFPIPQRECAHVAQGRPVDVSGTGGRRLGARKDGRGGNPNKPLNLADARDAMGIDWMSRRELSQAIPPAYARHVASAVLAPASPEGRA